MNIEPVNSQEVLERFRIYTLKFNKRLPEHIFKKLISENTFIAKYTSIKVLKIDEDIQAYLINSMNINYTLNTELIQAQSPFVSDKDIIINGLKSMADLINSIYEGLNLGYVIEEGVDFRYIENCNLETLFNGARIAKLLKKEFGNNIFLVSSKYIYKTANGDKVFNITYADSKDFTRKRLLIEADEEYVDRLYGVLKK